MSSSNSTSEQTSSDSDASAEASPSRSPWLLPLLLALVLVGVISGRTLLTGSSGPAASGNAATVTWTPSPQPTGETVALTIDYGNGATLSYAALPWQEGLTVLGLMESAAEFRPGIRFVVRGSGPMAKVGQINSLADEQAGGRNWTFYVNDAWANRSAGVYELQPGDRVLWKFAEYE